MHAIRMTETCMRDLPMPTLPLAGLLRKPRLATYGAEPQLPGSTKPATTSESPVHVAWARDAADVLDAQRLRYQVFCEEMGARLPPPPGAPAGHDVDMFDAYCEHLLVREAAPEGERGRVLGTYRV